MVIGVVGSGRRHAVDQLSARDLPNVHGVCCIINLIDAKAQFPALNPIHTLYGDLQRRCNQAHALHPAMDSNANVPIGNNSK